MAANRVSTVMKAIRGVTGFVKNVNGGMRMTAKEFLQQYLQAERSINAKLEEISRLRDLATRTTQTLEKDKIFVKTSIGDRTAAIVDKIVDLEREVDDEIDKLQEIRRQVLAVINGVTDTSQRCVLTLRYIHGMRFEEIAVKLNYHYRWVIELHGRGLRAVENTALKCTS